VTFSTASAIIGTNERQWQDVSASSGNCLGCFNVALENLFNHLQAGRIGYMESDAVNVIIGVAPIPLLQVGKCRAERLDIG
jgi:hypothetical protein